MVPSHLCPFECVSPLRVCRVPFVGVYVPSACVPHCMCVPLHVCPLCVCALCVCALSVWLCVQGSVAGAASSSSPPPFSSTSGTPVVGRSRSRSVDRSASKPVPVGPVATLAGRVWCVCGVCVSVCVSVCVLCVCVCCVYVCCVNVCGVWLHVCVNVRVCMCLSVEDGPACFEYVVIDGEAGRAHPAFFICAPCVLCVLDPLPSASLSPCECACVASPLLPLFITDLPLFISRVPILRVPSLQGRDHRRRPTKQARPSISSWTRC
jgi:hypothetical protein